jgi:pimeloyl-ACP methyl ester carboxylesterase
VKLHSVAGGGGAALHVFETGNPAGLPILFIHGWSQSHASWTRQLNAPALRERFRLLALDLRGHGDSEKPVAGYDDPALWAADINAVIETLQADRPVLTGWSYGGYVICDYLRHYGQQAIRGINFAAAAVDRGVKVDYQGGGDGWDDVWPDDASDQPHIFSEAAEDAATAMRRFVRNCVAAPLPFRDELAFLGLNLMTPPRVRKALFERKIRNDDVLAGITVPVLVSQGERDRIVHSDSARHIAAGIRGAQLSLYPEAGHAVFYEAAERFNAELAEFTLRA